MIDHKYIGIFAHLNNESKLKVPSGKNFTSNVHKSWSSMYLSVKPKKSIEEGFLIRHFAGDVFYDTVSENRIFKLSKNIQYFFLQEKFVSKNTDLLSKSTFDITKKVLSGIISTPNAQFNSAHKYRSESSSNKEHLRALLDVLNANVI